MLISSDANDFVALQTVKNRIQKRLQQASLLGTIGTCLEQHQCSMSEINATTAVPELRSFLFKSVKLDQFVRPAFCAPFVDPKSQKRLHRQFQRLHAKVKDNACVQHPKNTTFFERTPTEASLLWIRPGEFEMYCVFSPLVTKKDAMTAANRAAWWIKREELNLFHKNNTNW